MTVTPIKTKAEQQFAAQFEAAAAHLPGSGWVPAARRTAMSRFVATGLPHRRLEAWKYTDLRNQMQAAFAPAQSKPQAISEKTLAAALGPELAALKCARLVFVDGVLCSDACGPTPGLNETWSFVALADGLADKTFAWLAAAFGAAAEAPDDMLLALNAAFVTDGVILRVFEGHELAQPIHLVFVSTTGTPAASSTRNFIRIEKNGRATVLETHIAIEPGPRQSNAVTQVQVCEGAHLHHLKLIAEGANATHLGTAIAHVETGATYSVFQMTESVALARHQLFLKFIGESASFQFNGAVLARGKSHIDTTMEIDHAVPKCTSRELIKAVLDDEARGVFQGKVIVRPDAQKSDGKQSARALLLSPTAEFDSKPELEIYADDVVCGHASTVAEVDEDQVFYLMARGIPRAQARALLIEAFAAEAIESVAHKGIREAMGARLQAWLREPKA